MADPFANVPIEHRRETAMKNAKNIGMLPFTVSRPTDISPALAKRMQELEAAKAVEAKRNQ